MSTFTDENIKYLRETLFKLYDKDDNGTLSMNEAAHLWRALGANPKQTDVQNMFKLTVGGDEKEMKCDDFVTYMKDHGGLDTLDREQEELAEAFRVFDKDNSGYISKDELKDIMGARGEEPLSDHELDDLMNKIDTNKDNKIDYKELISIMFRSEEDDEEEGEFDEEEPQYQDHEEGY